MIFSFAFLIAATCSPIEAVINNALVGVAYSCFSQHQDGHKTVAAGCSTPCSQEGLAFCRQNFLETRGMTSAVKNCTSQTTCNPVGGTCRVMALRQGPHSTGTLEIKKTSDGRYQVCYTCPKGRSSCTFEPAYECGCDSTL